MSSVVTPVFVHSGFDNIPPFPLTDSDGDNVAWAGNHLLVGDTFSFNGIKYKVIERELDANTGKISRVLVGIV